MGKCKIVSLHYTIKLKTTSGVYSEKDTMDLASVLMKEARRFHNERFKPNK